MNEELHKSLIDLIDETINEIEDLKKSRFSASEIQIKGPGEGIAGKPSDGKLDAAKAEDKKDDKKDEEKCPKCHKEPCECDDAKKGEDDPADSAETKRKLKELTEKGENEEAAKAEKDDKKDDKDEPHKDDPKHEEKEKKAIKDLADMHDMKKSQEEMSSLMKSFIDERVKPLEDKLSTLLDIVNKIADQPVAPKGATARTVPLMKSADEPTETLSKAQVASKLFELKKSGNSVDSLDVTKAEMGQDLEQIVKKYNLS